MSKRSYTDPTRKGCKRCGSKTVAWEQGKNKRWYLTEVFEDAAGATYTEHALLHSTFCGKPGLHDLEQSSRIAAEKEDERETEEISRNRQERHARDEAGFFLELHNLCKTQREVALDELASRQRELDRILVHRDRIGIMTDRERELQRVKRLTTEIAFMQAALGITQYEDDEQ